MQEKAHNAGLLLSNPLMVEVFGQLRERYMAELLSASPGSLTALEPHAKLRALEAVEADIRSFQTDEKFRLKGY